MKIVKMIGRFRQLTPVLLAIVILFVPAALFATMIMPSTEEQMAQRSDLIALGRVVYVQSRWDLQRPVIVTDVMLIADRLIKGSRLIPSDEILITFEGGQVGDERDEVHGMPVFHAGEEVLCFLKRNLDGKSFHVFAMSYGKYGISLDPETGRKVVDGPSFHVRMKFDLDTKRPMRTEKRPKRVLLEDFLEEIADYLGTR